VAWNIFYDGGTAETAPAVIQSALSAQKEGEGTTSFSATLASDATAGRTLLSFVGLRTSIFTGPVTGNNGNTHTQQDSQAFPAPYTTYSMRSYRAYGVSGGSAHSVSGSKSSGATEEVTTALIALDGGSIVDSGVALSAAAGAGRDAHKPYGDDHGPGAARVHRERHRRRERDGPRADVAWQLDRTSVSRVLVGAGAQRPCAAVPRYA
jgi:hypothetical protein